MATTHFTQLEVWKKAHAAVLEVYRLTRGFPPDEKDPLVSQMRRAAVSIPANIAEGFGRRSAKDKAHFYTVGLGSLEELRYSFILARDLGYGDASEVGTRHLNEVSAMLRVLVSKTLKMDPARFGL
jgi:four helix bundle protein